jgi:hypothetical protein
MQPSAFAKIRTTVKIGDAQYTYTPPGDKSEPLSPLRFPADWGAVIPGMATKVDEVRKTFAQRMEERAFQNITVSPGQIEAEDQRKDYEFWMLKLDPERDARAIMAVRIVPFGNDLWVEWVHLELSGILTKSQVQATRFIGVFFGLILLILGAVFPSILEDKFCGWLPTMIAIILGVVLLLVAILGSQEGSRGYDELNVFQKQESWAFQQSVDQALREALDFVGISTEMIREVPKEKRAI